MFEIWQFFMNRLTGFLQAWMLLWSAAVVFAWFLFCRTVPYRPLLIFLGIGFLLALLTGIYLQEIIRYTRYRFAPGTTGILILRIQGDDNDNTFQRELTSSLNTQIQQLSPKLTIEVHACDKGVDESMGSSVAHRRARAIGQQAGARVVIWGQSVSAKKFIPRITLVDEEVRNLLRSCNLSLPAQDVSELTLPSQLLENPICLAEFTAGYLTYSKGNYQEALRYFEAALAQGTLPSQDMAELLFHTAVCYIESSFCAREKTTRLKRAIVLLEIGSHISTTTGNALYWADVQISLGGAYSELPDGDLADNLARAIITYQRVLKVVTDIANPEIWAKAQTHLGVAYFRLADQQPSADDKVTSLNNSVAAFEAALRVYKEKTHSVEWARVQLNLGNTYNAFPEAKRPIKEALSAFAKALRVFSQKKYPRFWAMVQNNIGIVYLYCTQGDRIENLNKALNHFNAALRFHTEDTFPEEWARANANIGATYMAFPLDEKQMYMEQALDAYQATLRVYTEEEFLQPWVQVQQRLAHIYIQRKSGAPNTNSELVIASCEAVLRVIKQDQYPDTWVDLQMLLGAAYGTITNGDIDANLTKSVNAIESALRVLSEEKNPQEWAMAEYNLGIVCVKLSKGDRKTNLEKAVSAFKAASRVFTAEDKERGAMVQTNLTDVGLRQHLLPGPLLWGAVQTNLADTEAELKKEEVARRASSQDAKNGRTN